MCINEKKKCLRLFSKLIDLLYFPNNQIFLGTYYKLMKIVNKYLMNLINTRNQLNNKFPYSSLCILYKRPKITEVVLPEKIKLKRNEFFAQSSSEIFIIRSTGLGIDKFLRAFFKGYCDLHNFNIEFDFNYLISVNIKKKISNNSITNNNIILNKNQNDSK